MLASQCWAASRTHALLYTFASYVLILIINTRKHDPFTRSLPENVPVILQILSVLFMDQIRKHGDTDK